MKVSQGYETHLLVLVALLGLAACTTFLLRSDSAGWWRSYGPDPSRSSVKEVDQVDPTSMLDRVLKDASMGNRTVIITTLNEAWAKPNSIFDVFLEGFRAGEGTRSLLNHLVVVAVDRVAMNRCESMKLHCHLLTLDGVGSPGSEKRFMTREYFMWMWARTRFLGKVLELGYSFVLTDVDILWFRTPFSHFSPADDFTIACDFFSGNTYAIANRVNGGFIYVRSNNRTVSFYKHWYEVRERYPGKNEQEVFDRIKGSEPVRRLGVKMRFLDTAVFGGFCEHGHDLSKLSTLHANCCVGQERKIADMKMVLDVWRRFTSLSEDQKRRGIPWRAPVKCHM